MKTKSIFLALTALALLSTASFAGTVPSTFDANCNVNWVNGGCGDISTKGSLQITHGHKVAETKPPCDHEK